jgi:ClpP class serine protease
VRFEASAGTPLAIDPRAIGALVLAPPTPQVELRDGVALVSIRGPLSHHAGGIFDSYDAIKARVAQALDGQPKAVVLSIDSPGGECSGCIEAADEIRAMCDAAGVPLVSYVEGRACSAGYALACAAHEIVAQPSAVIGSIGTVTELVDATALDATMGLKIELVASGERKLDGNVHVPTSDGARLATKALIGGLADLLFAHVAKYRPLSIDEVRALDAGLVLAAQALEAEKRGLVDTIGTLPQLLARLAGANAAASGTERDQVMTLEETRKALQAIADDGEADDEERAKARSALKAMDGDGDEEKKEEPEAECDDKEPEARAATAGASADATSALVARIDRIEASERQREIAAVIATRPDISTEQRAFAASLATPSDVEKYLATIEKKARRNPAADVQPGTIAPEIREGAAPGPVYRQSAEAARAMRVRMGLEAEKRGVVDRGNELIIGGVVPPSSVR